MQGCDVRSDLVIEGPRRPSVGVSYPVIISVLITDLPLPLMSSLSLISTHVCLDALVLARGPGVGQASQFQPVNT